MPTALVWFRRDLRLHDHPPLQAAVGAGYRVVPVYIHESDDTDPWPPGAASRWWLHFSLQRHREQLRRQRSELVVRRGRPLDVLRQLLRETGAEAVYWQRRYEPATIERDRGVKEALRADGVDARSFPGALLFEPWRVRSGNDQPYRAFSPFWRACQALGEPGRPDGKARAPLPEAGLPDGLAVEDLGLLPRIPWDDGLRETWSPGEAGAEAALSAFLEEGLSRYDAHRDLPALRGTSRLSPHLHFGEISPRQAFAATRQRMAAGGAGVTSGGEKFLAELGWREFAHHVLYHNPHFPDEPLNPRFAHFPWRDDDGGLLQAWRAGRTGIPLVDAGMRELWRTGWMHNRIRMVVGSFLVKNLRLPWQWGESWFWDTLVDADLASNSLGWQWVAGSGADAAPYFRVFNPVRQAERFDPDGEYIARWVPELAALPARARRAPWEADATTLRRAGVQLGRDYPRPIVDLKRSREEALEAFQAIKNR
ncbi:deoxyribodipyrimidine photo-lyase [Ectothiorhodospiraceae bacterium WFHF3C12]|nr:deoxyribodipyrimidine photo-lyase [Ectothiorhodospiraceae bacterium WFHF3C12]